MSKLKIIIEVLIAVLIVILDAIGLVPITQTLFIFILVVVSLRIRKESWSSIGFSNPGNLGRSILTGIFFGIVFELIAAYLTTPMISKVFEVEPDYSSFQGIQGDLGTLIFFIVLSWILGAFGEEICFRGFIMTRISQLFNSNQISWIISLVLSSILFGYGHTEQGISGWIQEGISGLLLGVLFLAGKKNLVIPIVSHGVSNTLAFTLMYFGVYPGMGY